MRRENPVYPRSFLQLILISYLLVLLPVLVAAGYLTATMNTLSGQNRRMVQDATRTTHVVQDLANHLDDMERNLRQYDVLGDKELLAEFRTNREEFVQLLKGLEALHPIVGVKAPLDSLVEQADSAINAALDRSPSLKRANYLKAMDAISEMENVMPSLIRTVEHDTNVKIASNEALAASTQNNLLISLMISILAALLIVLVFGRVIATQMSQFKHAVATLGAGNYGEEIHFLGPRDMRFLGEQLEWLRQKLRELEVQRHRFLRNISHDLKTPLTVLREGTQLLADGVGDALSQQQQHIVNIMNENGSRLQGMIEDLLRAQQASLAVAGINAHALRLDLICQQVIRDHQLLARARDITLRAELPEIVVEGVWDHLQKVVDNLLSNAIKFSPAGGEVGICLGIADDSLVLTVSDDGPGIPEHEREQVFEPFFRGALTRSSHVEGSGVGLAISRDFVTAHGGTLKILPSTRGTCLEVRLPLQQVRRGNGESLRA